MFPEIRDIVLEDVKQKHCSEKNPNDAMLEKKYEHYISVWSVICERLGNNETHLILNEELCKLRWLAATVDNIYPGLVGSPEMSKKLASEIFNDFSFLSKIQVLYDSYTYQNSTFAYFIDQLNWNPESDIWPKFESNFVFKKSRHSHRRSPQSVAWNFVTNALKINTSEHLSFEKVGFLYSSLYQR